MTPKRTDAEAAELVKRQSECDLLLGNCLGAIQGILDLYADRLPVNAVSGLRDILDKVKAYYARGKP